MTARYRVMEKTFFSPHMIEAGSIIETDAEPGQTWEPLNDEAHEAKEKWYNKEITVFNSETGKPEVHKPHVNKRPVAPGEALVQPKIALITKPAAEVSGEVEGLSEETARRGQPDLIELDPGASTASAGKAAEADNGKVISAEPPKKDKV